MNGSLRMTDVNTLCVGTTEDHCNTERLRSGLCLTGLKLGHLFLVGNFMLKGLYFN